MMADVGSVLATSCNDHFGQVIEAHVKEFVVPLSILCSHGIQEPTHLGIRKSQDETLPEFCTTLDVLSGVIDWIQSKENVHIRYACFVSVVEVVEPKRVFECTVLLRLG